jgi:hypothetical protein
LDFGFECFCFLTFGSFRSDTVPPAFSTFSRAVAEIACTRTVSFLSRSPFPSSLTSVFVFFSSPFSTRLSGVTSAPSSKRSSALTLIGAVDVRNGPIGIASLEVAPRCLPRRM